MASNNLGISNYGIMDPERYNLTLASSLNPNGAEQLRQLRAVTCYILATPNEEKNDLGSRISSVFVIFAISTAVTFFPVLAVRAPKLKIPLFVYLFARYFGAGVIIATAFIHLLDPAYAEIGPQTCVGTTHGWRGYSWPPAIALSSAMITFLLEFIAERWVEKKYGLRHAETAPNEPARSGSVDLAMMRYELGRRPSVASVSRHATHQNLHSSDQDGPNPAALPQRVQTEKNEAAVAENDNGTGSDMDSIDAEKMTDIAFKQQITAFLILEFGVLFHSTIIGLALATSSPSDFATLYPVLIFHQSFEGLGIGARLSAIPFPKHLHWMPWALCAGYGLTTPIAIAAGLGVRTTYNANSFTANVVAGTLDSISAGILMYTGFVELIARDFLFNPDRTNNDKQLAFMTICLFLGAGIMALVGKWA